MRYAIETTPNLTVFQQPVSDLVLENNQVTGVVLAMGLTLRSKTVVITAETFLAGQIHIGMNQQSGGRAGDPASNDLAKSLRDKPFRIARLKTGTPPRIDSRSVDLASLPEQPGAKAPIIHETDWILTPCPQPSQAAPAFSDAPNTAFGHIRL
mgnify:CR=1 FL=1